MKLWSCLVLPPGIMLVLLSKEGSQVKSQSTGNCIQSSVDTNGQVVVGVVTDCVCDPTCDICGYYGEAVSGPEDCFSCADGLFFNRLYSDGSGTCTTTENNSTDIGTSPSDNTTSTGGICFMVYQLADNNLEADLRKDLSQMTESAITQSASTVTWVYHDALYRGSPDFTGGPLADVYNPDGTPLTGRFDGSRYLTWDHDLGKMIVDTTFPSELNSDKPAVLQAFVEYALTDCISKGSSEFFLDLSSHGAGFAGFGGDDDTRRRARKLLQSNPDIRFAIEGALLSVPGAPSMLDVLGFDACLMQSMDAIDDFANITKYYLASEATEPGHGWAYNELPATTSALELASNVLNTFLSSEQDYGYQATPKTMALVDTALYPAFRDAWDTLFSAMADILASGTDADFHSSLMRARANTFAFEGYLDSTPPPPQVKSAMDIGNFFQTFFQLCNPDESSELYMLLVDANNAYSEMFVSAGVGPGTSDKATGMQITWVSKQEVLSYPEFYKKDIFPTTGPFPLLGAPNYSRFLELFYYTSTPTENVGPSVCGTSTKSSRLPTSSSELIIDPTVTFLDAVNTEIRSEITQNVDFVVVQYGIDVTELLEDESLRRRLDEVARRQEARRLEFIEGEEEQLSSFAHRGGQAMKLRYRYGSERTRILQGGEDHYYIYGGDVAVQYNGSNIVAYWDSTFFWIQSGDKVEPVYALDVGGDLKSIPVCYFDENSPISSAELSLGVTVDDAIAFLGCEYGFMSFSAAEDSGGKFSLYVYGGNYTSLNEVPVATGRNVVPITYIDYSVGGLEAYELLGGYSSIVIPWSPGSNFSYFTYSDFENLEVFGTDVVFIQIYAFDDDSNITDDFLFPYTFGVNVSDSSTRRHLVVHSK